MYQRNYGLHKTPAFEKWFNDQPQMDKWYILERFTRIVIDNYFGDHKYLEDGLWELKWNNGRRIYYGYLAQLDIVVVLGGSKNGQNRDISKAKRLFKEYKKAFKER